MGADVVPTSREVVFVSVPPQEVEEMTFWDFAHLHPWLSLGLALTMVCAACVFRPVNIRIKKVKNLDPLDDVSEDS